MMPFIVPNNTKELYTQLTKYTDGKVVFGEFESEKILYKELKTIIDSLTGVFLQHGLKAGDKVVISTKSDIQVSILFLAALFNDLVPTVIADDTQSMRAEAIFTKLRANYYFVSQKNKKEWKWLDNFEGRCLPEILAKQHFALFQKRTVLDRVFPQFFERSNSLEPPCSANSSDVAYILFTSGTTSKPKGVMISHKSLFSHLKTITNIFGYGAKSKIFNNMSLAHADGIIQGPVLCLFSKATLYRPKSFTIQNIEPIVNGIYANKITHFITVPTILSLMDKFLKENDYFEDRKFESIISVAGKLNQDVWERLQDKFNVRICNIYGLTETVAGGIFCGPNDNSFCIGTLGKPIDIEAKIVNEEGKICEVNEEGELLLRGSNTFTGYFDEPEETSKMFTQKWLHTGDIVKVDEKGFYCLLGRKKSVIISGGFNIHPDEVTEVILRHPKVNETITIGLLDNDWGEVVTCAITSSSKCNEDEIINHCRKHLEPHKVPKNIYQLDSLPWGLSGKIKLPKIREEIEKIKNNNKAEAGNFSIKSLVALTSALFNVPLENIRADLAPNQIPGWDSLGHLNLITTVEEEFDVQFTVEEMMRVNCLQDILDIMKVKQKKQ